MLFQSICMLPVSFRSTYGITWTPLAILILEGEGCPLLGRASMSMINDTISLFTYSVPNGGNYLASTCVKSWLCSTNQKWLEDNIVANFRATPRTRLDEIWGSNKVILPTRRPLPSTDTRCLRASMKMKELVS